ncbi:MAG: alpha/beta fold hydrolase [Actinobacteria bacterium]|nr:alpha/beta fold hydrolase [Actinomycetota bacterium]
MGENLARMRLRLYHHGDGARIAYREAGAGPGLALLHSLGLSHREWEPVVEPLSRRFRVVLPDLPLHGDSEDRPRHPYTPEWLAEVVAGFCAEVLGPRPLVGGHDIGAELLLRAVLDGHLTPRRLVLMPNRLHRRAERRAGLAAWRGTAMAAVVPGLDRLLARAAPLVFRPSLGEKLSAQRNPAARDLVRHALADLPGNRARARSWARFARRWPSEPWRELFDAYGRVSVPTLLLWADEDPLYPIAAARQALDLLPDGQLRTLDRTGFLLAYDDPVGLARELISFCG